MSWNSFGQQEQSPKALKCLKNAQAAQSMVVRCGIRPAQCLAPCHRIPSWTALVSTGSLWSQKHKPTFKQGKCFLLPLHSSMQPSLSESASCAHCCGAVLQRPPTLLHLHLALGGADGLGLPWRISSLGPSGWHTLPVLISGVFSRIAHCRCLPSAVRTDEWLLPKVQLGEPRRVN